MSSHLLRQPLTGFLNLAPATSGSYPQQQQQQQQQAAAAAPAAPAAAAPSSPSTTTKATRRSSSVSTVNSAGGAAPRFLKLGPVHFGEHLDPENKDDWSAVSEE
jgi:hypothetical protein